MKKKLSNGDVIRVSRKMGLYSHYGIYVMDSNTVIHYTGATDPDDFNGIVRETSLDEFLNGAKDLTVCVFPKNPPRPRYPLINFMVNLIAVRRLSYLLWQFIKKSRLKNYHLYSGDETVERASGEIGKGGYNLALNNCEHFAVWCKTGVRDSSQVDKILDFLTYFWC